MPPYKWLFCIAFSTDKHWSHFHNLLHFVVGVLNDWGRFEKNPTNHQVGKNVCVVILGWSSYDSSHSESFPQKIIVIEMDPVFYL